MQARRVVIAGLAVVAVALLWGVALADLSPPRLEQVGVEVSISLSDPGRSIYECTAVITDLASDRVIAEPRVLFPAGESAAIRSGTEPGLEVMITVGVDQEESNAWYSAKIYQGRTVVSSQTVEVALRG